MNYSPEIAGVGKFTGEIGEFLVRRGVRVDVVTAPGHYPGWKALPGEVNWWNRENISGAHVQRSPLYLSSDVSGWKRLLPPLTFSLSSAFPMLHAALRGKPDVVLAIEPTLLCAPLALLASRLTGSRSVIHVQDLEVDAAFAMRNLPNHSSFQRLALLTERSLLNQFERIITISDAMAERIVGKGIDRSRVFVVRNWVDLNSIKEHGGGTIYRDELGIGHDATVALYSGNLGAKQGIPLLIELAGRLAVTSQIKVVIAGDGPLRPEVQRASEQLSNLTYVPLQPAERFSDFLQMADLNLLPQEKSAADLVLPSKLGGLLASGKPIVYTADPGTELARFLDGVGERVIPGNAADFERAVLLSSRRESTDARQDRQRELAKLLSKHILIERFAELALFDVESPVPNRVAEE